MAIESRPFGGVTLTGKDADAFREQFLKDDETEVIYDAEQYYFCLGREAVNEGEGRSEGCPSSSDVAEHGE